MSKRTKIIFFAAALIAALPLFFAACSDVENTGGGNLRTVPVENIEIQGGNITLKTGTSTVLSVTVYPEDAGNKNVKWASGNTGKVTVSRDGLIEAVSVGTVVVTAEALDGSSVYSYIIVTVTDEDPVPVESVTVNGGDLTLNAGMSVALSVTVLPEDAGNKNVKWESSDTGTVTVSQNGRLTAAGEGSATVTATARDGSGTSGSIIVTVRPANSENGNEGPGTEVVQPPQSGTNISGDVTITESRGWLETLYVKWQKLQGAESYNVYYKSGAGGNAVTNWTKIDDPLIREYGTYFRADIPGLAAGVYEVKVHPVNGAGAEGANPATAANIEVKAHVRSGFAFKDGAVPGAYKADGTPKDGARILYITDSSKETAKLSMIINTNNRDEERTGLQDILSAYEKGYESRPLIIRFIGTVKEGGSFTDKEGTAMIKGNSSRPLAMNITFEGIGDDATVHGWGFRSSRANHVEIRNLGFMLANTKQKDAVELQNSKNMWVHNCDFFYMKPGSASDQKKGDGTLDIKECDLVTISYNHFWDAGKTNLLGNGTETAGYLTYHHNWYDHSDSRNPRVRCHHVHVYNNYYDGVAKYGIGATMGSSIFAEGNYFRNTKKPLLISMQGSDISSGAGTFSSENGGIIKAYNNFMDAQSAAEYRPWSNSNTIEFDAYEAQSAGQSVPATVKAKKGGASFSNFDITHGYAYTADTPLVAKENVTTWAGRYWGGDFGFTFNNATDDAKADDPMPELLAKLNAYTSGLVGIQGE